MTYSRKEKLLYIGPVILALLLFSIFPLIYSVKNSFYDLNIAREGTGRFVGFSNFITLFKPDGLFLKALRNTFLLALVSLSLQIITGFMMAKLLYTVRNKPLFSVLRTMYILPIMVTPMAFGIIWTYILNPTQGVANYFLSLMNFTPRTWFGHPSTALATVVLVDWWQYTPFVATIILAGLFTIEPELYDASDVDGANWLQKILYVEIPNLTQVIGIAAILRLIDIIRMFDLIYVSTRGGPGGATEVISLYSYRQAFEYYNISLGLASALVAMVFTVILSTIFNNFTTGTGKK